MDRYARLNGLLEALNAHGKLDVDEAAELMGVSQATIRRDFDHLHQQQLITRTHGGAVANSVSYDLPLRYKTARHPDEKSRIAAAAAVMVKPDTVIALNGGTTTTEVGRAIALRHDLGGPEAGPTVTVVTNAINIANELLVRPQLKLVMTGGVVRAKSYELFGPLASRVLAELSLDQVFLGVDAISPDHGASAHNDGEASTNRDMVRLADEVIIVADSSKLGRRAFARICQIREVDKLVTDVGASREMIAAFEAAGVEVIAV